jgi:Fe-S cluster assembly protein SufB
MPKYTEDDLKSNSKLKNISTVYTELEADTFPIGLNEDIVRAISMRKRNHNG